jgi:hypothetical protein
MTNTIVIADIVIEKRMRSTDTNHVKALAASIKDHGLTHPPTLWLRPDGQYQLVAGMHRIAAYKLNGQTEIPYTLFDVGNEHVDIQTVNVQLAEAQENAVRLNLGVIGTDLCITRVQDLNIEKLRIRDHLDRESKLAAAERLRVEGETAEDRQKGRVQVNHLTKAIDILRNRKNADRVYKAPIGASTLTGGQLNLTKSKVEKAYSNTNALGREDAELLSDAKHRNEQGVMYTDGDYDNTANRDALKELKKSHPGIAAKFLTDLRNAHENPSKYRVWPDHPKKLLADIKPVPVEDPFQAGVAAINAAKAALNEAETKFNKGILNDPTMDKWFKLVVHERKRIEDLITKVNQERSLRKQNVTGNEGKYQPVTETQQTRRAVEKAAQDDTVKQHNLDRIKQAALKFKVGNVDKYLVAVGDGE